jgi:flavin-binding protein dodecin
MSKPEHHDYHGSSPESFAAAAQNAVKEAEEKGLITDEVELRVVEMSVLASHNPISEYRVVLSPPGG